MKDFPKPVKNPVEYPFIPNTSFPTGFAWGLGTAAYQIEGAYNEDGRGASIWDTFTGANTVGMPGTRCSFEPCPVSSVMGLKGATGNVANDFYHKYKQDIAMMGSMGVKNYRFSIAWPRVVPTGVMADGTNPSGIEFYHNVIDELLAHGIEPIVTMYHWDLPQGLLDFYWNQAIPTCDSTYRQGWFECKDGTSEKPVPSGLDSRTVQEFGNYAKLLFKEYGSKVKFWYTFNEAWTFTFLGSGLRGKAPNVQPWMDTDLWPFVAGHNVIIAHALASDIFNRMKKEGVLDFDRKIGMVNNQDWREPNSTNPSDIAAAEYAIEGQLGWFCDPVFGVDGKHDYPSSMKMTLPYLPSFTEKETELLSNNRPDVFGLNHYGTGYQTFNCSGTGTAFSSCTTEQGLPMAVSTWLFQAAWGFRKLLNWVADRYGRDLPIWGTESGWSDNTIEALQAKYDTGRTMYYYSYLQEVWNAINVDGVNVQGFLAWSLMDNFEWERGYNERFGCLWTDFNFGEDPNSPGASASIYDAEKGYLTTPCGAQCSGNKNVPAAAKEKAYAQTRHAKDSILWLQWVWQSNALADPARFLAASIGTDICYGEGVYPPTGANCSLSSPLPGPAPVFGS